MTKQELIEMVGNEEQAAYALEIVLKNLQPGFIRTVVNLELKAIDEEIQKMKGAGFIVTNNGHDSVNWGKAMQLNGWNLSEEQQAEYDKAMDTCANCNSLLYKKNRTISLIAIRG